MHRLKLRFPGGLLTYSGEQADLREKIKKDEVFILDVRNQASFDAGHIPGSKLIPSGEILNHLDELPKDKLIVTYCS